MKSTKKLTPKPGPEAKALSLYLMAFKNSKPMNKENARRINKQWDQVKQGAVSTEDYLIAVNAMLKSYGGYEKVVEETVWYYIKKTGKWTLDGNDKYAVDAKRFADEILKKKRS